MVTSFNLQALQHVGSFFSFLLPFSFLASLRVVAPSLSHTSSTDLFPPFRSTLLRSLLAASTQTAPTSLLLRLDGLRALSLPPNRIHPPRITAASIAITLPSLIATSSTSSFHNLDKSVRSFDGIWRRRDGHGHGELARRRTWTMKGGCRRRRRRWGCLAWIRLGREGGDASRREGERGRRTNERATRLLYHS